MRHPLLFQKFYRSVTRQNRRELGWLSLIAHIRIHIMYVILYADVMMSADMNDVGGLVEETSDAQKKSKRQTSSTPTIELMVYVDAEVQSDARENGFSVTEYILGIINIVSDCGTFILHFLIPCYCMHRWRDCIVILLCRIKLI